MLAVALLTFLLGGASPPVLDCPLAKDIADAALTRTIYLGGVFEETDSVVEKVTLAAEIGGLDQLRDQMLVWHLANCQTSQ